MKESENTTTVAHSHRHAHKFVEPQYLCAQFFTFRYIPLLQLPLFY